jgi:5'(3')-deoxyribonucleotidase
MRVLCDVDGVLAQWKTVFKYHLSQVDFHIDGINWVSPDLPLTTAQRSYAWHKMYERDVALNLDPFPNAIKGLKRIMEIADVYFVTAQVEKSPTWCYDRTNWLIKHFGEEQGNKIILTHHKEICSGDVLIDDKEYNIKAWKEEHPDGLAVLWDHPHNWGQDTVGIRCKEWSDLHWRIKNKQLKG